MQANRNLARCRPQAVQRAVLALTLDRHPHWYPLRDLRREIGCGGVVHQAMRELVAIGLVERQGPTIRPTPAAAHFEQLNLP